MKTSFRVAAGTLLAITMLNSAFTKTAPAADPKITPLITGLDNPCGVALHASSGDLFVSDSAAGRVVRFNPQSAGKAVPVITDFIQDIYGKGPMYNIGPLGLGFIDANTLVVGGGENKDGAEVVSIYTLPAAGKSIKAGATKQKLGPLTPSEETKMGEGNFYGVAVTKDAIYISSNGDDTKGWVLKSEIADGKAGALKPFIATKVALEDTDAPVGITVGKDGGLIVGQMGEMNKPNDSLLTVYDSKTGKLTMRAATGLHDIAAVAFSPKSGKLYCVDFAWINEKEGGLFRLDMSKEGGVTTVKAAKICSLDKPTAMAFAADGTLYVTEFGTAAADSKIKPGRLLKIAGDL